jgi:nucleotide-binding universal stress UspA family protein
MPVAERVAGLTLDRIVVASDFKAAAMAATEFASVWAKHFSSTLTVVHVVDLTVATRSEAAMAGWPLEQMRHDGADNMGRTLTPLISMGLNVRGQQLESYKPAAAIVGFAEKIDADLLVIGSKARHGLSKLIMGSCAEGVIHHAKCPVLTLGPKVKSQVTEGFDLKTVIFATDLLHNAAEKAETALAFAKESLAKVYMCHIVNDRHAERLETIDMRSESELALLKLVPVSTYEWCNMEYVVASGDIGEHIVALAKSTEADLIVLGARRTTSYATNLTKSVVESVLSEAACPVMTICTD